MSLYGALYSAVSGLSSESSAMGAISDNITNINTTGYKDTSINFSTLVTTQTATTSYSPGGVDSLPRQNVNVQGLLQATNSSTDMAISGGGMFVVNTSPTPASTGGNFFYTRAGSFTSNQNGYLENAQGYFLQGWPLTPTDNSAQAVPGQETIDGTTYMKAYKNADGTTHYVNQNIIDPTEVQPLNVNDIGGTAQATSNVSLGLNLPSGDPVYASTNPSAGGAHDSNVLLYDTLGDTENAQFNWSKIGNNAWALGVAPPPGAAQVTVTNQAGDGTSTVYGAEGQLEFNSVPAAGSYLTLTDTPSDGSSATNVRIQFYNSSVGGTNGVDPTSDTASGTDQHLTLGVNLNGITTTNQLVTALKAAMDQASTQPQVAGTYNISTALLGGVADGNSRFSAVDGTLAFSQEPGADAVKFNVQANASTGLGTSIIESNASVGSSVGAANEGIFTVPAIDSTYGQVNTGGTTNSFAVTDSLAALVPSGGTATTTATLQIGTTQIEWADILNGSTSVNYTDATTGLAGASSPVTVTPTYVMGTNTGDSLPITDAQASAAASAGDILDINGLQIPWATLYSGGTLTTLNTDATPENAGGGTVTLSTPITVTADSSGDGSGTAANIVSVINALSGDLNAGGYIGSLKTALDTTITPESTVNFTSSTQVSNIYFDQAGPYTSGLPNSIGAGAGGLSSTNTAAGTMENLGTTMSSANIAQNTADAITAMVAAGNILPTGFSAKVTAGSSTVALDSGDSPPTPVQPMSLLGYTTWADSTDGHTSEVMGMTGSYSATTGAAVSFNGDGTPSKIIPNAMAVTWANGSEDQYGTSGTATHKPQITLNLGDPNESTGVTQLGGDYSVNFITQDGAKFGNFAGLSIGSNGVVTALFDNGVRSPVFQIPVATFANPDGLASDTGNIFNATSASGAYTLRVPGDSGAGTVNQDSLEASTVDLGTEFTQMIVVQRAYSAATKIVTTADSMLQDLLQTVQG